MRLVIARSSLIVTVVLSIIALSAFTSAPVSVHSAPHRSVSPTTAQYIQCSSTTWAYISKVTATYYDATESTTLYEMEDSVSPVYCGEFKTVNTWSTVGTICYWYGYELTAYGLWSDSHPDWGCKTGSGSWTEYYSAPSGGCYQSFLWIEDNIEGWTAQACV